MELSQYQVEATKTAIFTEKLYPLLGLAGEVGEVGEHLKKKLRDGKLDRDALAAEMGDVLWYLCAIATQTEGKLNRWNDLWDELDDTLDTETAESIYLMMVDSMADIISHGRWAWNNSPALPAWQMYEMGLEGYEKERVAAVHNMAIFRATEDAMGYWLKLCNALGYAPGDIAQANIDKLRSRQERGVLKGSGSNR